jgi:hypothetical protein
MLLPGARDSLRRTLRGPMREARPEIFRARPQAVYAKAVGSFVPKLTQKAFEKYGFSTATLLTDWVQIAGADVAGYTVPERLKWPRGAGVSVEAEEGDDGRPGAVLVLRVDPARALDIEYRGRQLIERINAYFGYRAVAQLKLIQAPVAPAVGPKTPLQSPPARTPEIQSQAGDDPLASALARLGDRVLGHGGLGGSISKS